MMILPAPRAICTTSASTNGRSSSTGEGPPSGRFAGGEGGVGFAGMQDVDQFIERLRAERGRQHLGQLLVVVSKDGIDILEQTGGRRFAVVFEFAPELIERDLVERSSRLVAGIVRIGAIGRRLLGNQLEVAQPVQAFVENLRRDADEM